MNSHKKVNVTSCVPKGSKKKRHKIINPISLFCRCEFSSVINDISQVAYYYFELTAVLPIVIFSYQIQMLTETMMAIMEAESLTWECLYQVMIIVSYFTFRFIYDVLC